MQLNPGFSLEYSNTAHSQSFPMYLDFSMECSSREWEHSQLGQGLSLRAVPAFQTLHKGTESQNSRGWKSSPRSPIPSCARSPPGFLPHPGIPWNSSRDGGSKPPWAAPFHLFLEEIPAHSLEEPPGSSRRGWGCSQASFPQDLIPKGTEAGPGRLDFSFPFPEFAAGEHQGPVRYSGETGTLIWDH